MAVKERRQENKSFNYRAHTPPKRIMAKYERLKKLLAQMPAALVAYSGGVDSTFLLRVASEVLKDNVFAVVASSPIYPQREIREALALAKKMGVKVRVIETKEMANPHFLANPPDRCYFCKKELFSRLKEIGLQENRPFILDGTNYDDYKDYRPGSQAAKELEVCSPLAEVKLRKDEIRVLSRWLGLPTWNKPSMACLASRFPYFVEITPERLEKVAKAEEVLRRLGFTQVRVRHHGDDLARLEILPEQFPLIINPRIRKMIINQLKSLGYLYITFDLEGYRSGSLNLPLKKEK